MSVRDDLALAVADAESAGCHHMPRSLGFATMPEGYALMLNADGTHYFWQRHDGAEGPIDWNRWRVRRNAIANAEATP